LTPKTLKFDPKYDKIVYSCPPPGFVPSDNDQLTLANNFVPDFNGQIFEPGTTGQGIFAPFLRLIGNMLPSGSLEPGEGLFPDDPPGKKMKSRQIRALITTILENSFRIGLTINVMCFH
jgi:hypothetical protein